MLNLILMSYLIWVCQLVKKRHHLKLTHNLNSLIACSVHRSSSSSLNSNRTICLKLGLSNNNKMKFSMFLEATLLRSSRLITKFNQISSICLQLKLIITRSILNLQLSSSLTIRLMRRRAIRSQISLQVRVMAAICRNKRRLTSLPL